MLKENKNPALRMWGTIFWEQEAIFATKTFCLANCLLFLANYQNLFLRYLLAISAPGGSAHHGHLQAQEESHLHGKATGAHAKKQSLPQAGIALF